MLARTKARRDCLAGRHYLAVGVARHVARPVGPELMRVDVKLGIVVDAQLIVHVLARAVALGLAKRDQAPDRIPRPELPAGPNGIVGLDVRVADEDGTLNLAALSAEVGLHGEPVTRALVVVKAHDRAVGGRDRLAADL